MGRWSKFHDQRKGQWLVNYIRFNLSGRGEHEGKILFNMSNTEFDKLMEEYETKSQPTTWSQDDRFEAMVKEAEK